MSNVHKYEDYQRKEAQRVLHDFAGTPEPGGWYDKFSDFMAPLLAAATLVLILFGILKLASVILDWTF